MKLTKKTVELVCELESIVGNQCYNPKSHNGWTGEDGAHFRYPVWYTDKEGTYRETKNKIEDINPSGITNICYRFGANRLYIGDAIVDILNYLEGQYGISFNDLVKEKKRG